MSEVRRRKLKDHNGRTVPQRKRKDTTQNSLHRSLLCLIISGTILLVFLMLYIDVIPWYLGHRAIDTVARTFGHHRPVHAVVIDAGSTGSRVLAFSFHETFFGGNLVLDKELFEYTKPGLSAFVDNPEQGVATIASLLDKAKKEIPQEYWAKTPLILKATAGLRLLPPEKAEALLNSVKEYFKKTPFLTNANSVEIMDGTDEGIFSWFTVNFLLERIHGSSAQTVAAMDLGGGSTQVTFAALTPASLSQNQYIHQAVSPKGPIPVYTHSYLGLGLMAARKEVITLNQPNTQNVTSECINHIIQGKKFHFGTHTYYVSGPEKDYPTTSIKDGSFTVGQQNIPIVNFNKCSEIVKNYVATKGKAPEELPSKTIFAFSYYFDRATEAGLIDDATGGKIIVNDFKKAAESACHDTNADQPFMCLDLTFIWVLLEDGLGLSADTPIYLFKKINGHEISWALGAAYNLLKG